MNINPFDLMKQMGSIEAKMKSLKEDISKLTATAASGGGMVEVKINGDFKILSIDINELMIDKNEKNTLEVLIMSAFNEAVDKIRVMIEDETKRVAQGYGISQ